MPDVAIFDCNSGNFLTQKTEIKLQYMLIYQAIFNNKTEKSFNLKGCAMNDNFCNMMNQIFQFMANLLITEVKISYSKLRGWAECLSRLYFDLQYKNKDFVFVVGVCMLLSNCRMSSFLLHQFIGGERCKISVWYFEIF